ncbi:MAG: lipoprotein insertase outer membrane protein LolB [Proteobacteria bacterium]|nr:lipoprotein insertase outer membrane protein LolB [Pseudomonadota bacterium]
MPLSRLLPALVLTGILAACAQLPGAASGDAVPAQRPARANINDYLMTGRLAVNQGQQHYAVSITWRHTSERDEIFLATPLGQGVAELTRDAAGARLTTAERREFNAPDWQALSAQVFGFALPLSALPRWLLAEVPAEALGVKYDGAGRPQRMVANDWQVAYLEYASDAADALPALIELKHEDIEVRLKVDEWQLSP